MAITRHGVNRTNLGPLMKCSFEETVEILMDAAIFAEVDYMRAVSENCIVGQLCPIGTGVFDLHMDDTREDRDGALQCAMDEATPTLPHMKDLASCLDGGGSSPLPTDLPSPTPSPAEDQGGDQSVMDDLQSPAFTDGGEGTPGRSVGATPFSEVGTPGSQRPKTSPATPRDSSPFRSPSYTPAADDSPHGTSPADGISPSYVSTQASPAYTPDGSYYPSPTRAEDQTSSPSYYSQATAHNNRMGYSPTSDVGPGFVSPGYAVASTSAQAYSPLVSSPAYGQPAFEATSPVDTPMAYGMATSSPGHGMASSPVGAPASPVVAPGMGHAFATGADDAVDAMPQSPSYTPIPRGERTFVDEDVGPGADIVTNEDESDGEENSAFDMGDDQE
jgi:DNA-directed RNA polymerase II subunit RPB1